jgi:predicted GIY-YIG superfamily endonuclease
MKGSTSVSKTTLYRHYDKSNNLLYVGISLSHLQRLGQHSTNSHWFTKISNVTVKHFDTRQEAIEAERNAIRSEKPLHNIMHINYQEEENLSIPVAKRVLGAKEDMLTRIVNIELLYESSKLAPMLHMQHKELKAIIDAGELSYMWCHGTNCGQDRRKFFVSGWQLIDYMESRHHGA